MGILISPNTIDNIQLWFPFSYLLKPDLIRPPAPCLYAEHIISLEQDAKEKVITKSKINFFIILMFKMFFIRNFKVNSFSNQLLIQPMYEYKCLFLFH